MKKLIIIFLLLHLTLNTIFTRECMCQWVQQTLPVSGQIYDIAFLNKDTGFVSTYTPALLRTTNGGTNWEVIKNFRVYEMNVIDNKTLYCTGTNQVISSESVLYRTFDAGQTWDSIISYSIAYCDIAFINKDTGWISGFDGSTNRMYKTTNGGLTVNLISSNTGCGLLFFLKQPINGEYYGWNVTSGYLYKTTNSGVNWTGYSGMDGVQGVFFLNKDTGFVSAHPSMAGSTMFYTTNGGTNWSSYYMGTYDAFDIFFVNSQKGWAGRGNYKIFATSNGGVVWGTQNIPLFTNTLLTFVDTLTGWTGTTGLAKTTNGGGLITYIGLDSNNVSVPKSYTLKQNYPNPFNPQTTIEFSIKENSNVNLIIYDITGKEIFKIMESSMLKPGNYKAVLDFSKIIISSGVYFYTIIISDNKSKQVFKETKKMIYNK